MAIRKAKNKKAGSNGSSGPAKRQLALVGLAGLFLVIWGFVLGILVGRGMVPTLVEPKPQPAPVTVAPDRDGGSARAAGKVSAKSGKDKTDSSAKGDAKPLNQSNLEFFDQLAKKSSTTAPQLRTTTTTAKPIPKTTTTTVPKVEATTTTTTTAAPTAKTAAKSPTRKTNIQIEKKTEPSPSTRVAKSKGSYTVQAAAFRSRSDALKYAERISKRTGNKFKVVSGLSRGQLWHRVRLDARMSRLDAAAMRKELEGKGFKNPNVVRVQR